jgi:dUTP pyrophosphatase
MNGTNWWSTNPPVKFDTATPDVFSYDENGHLVGNTIRVKIKKLYDDAVVPTYAKQGDAGLDLTATHMTWDDTFIEYGTGIAIEIPVGYVGFIFPRSSVSKKENFYLKNSVGVIDSGYRGEIKLRFNNNNNNDNVYLPGDKVGQLIIMPYPTVTLELVDELSDSDRGNGGFGSTGK